MKVIPRETQGEASFFISKLGVEYGCEIRSHEMKPWSSAITFVGSYVGENYSFQLGFLRWFEMDFVHPQYGSILGVDEHSYLPAILMFTEGSGF